MNTTTSLQHRRTLFLATLSLMVAHLVSAAPFEWTGASGVDRIWSTAANWNPNGSPGAADAPTFGELDTMPDAFTVNNILGVSTTVATLAFSNTTAWHVTEIPAGNTLTVSGAFTVGGGSANNLNTSVAMVGGGTFVATGTAFIIGNGGAANPVTPGNLDLSNLTNFVYNASGGTIGLASFGSRGMGTFILAAISNSITAGTININGATGTGSQPRMRLGGGTNIINVNTFNVGGGRSTTTLDFLGGTGGWRLRGSAGTDSSRSTMVVGNRNTGGTSTFNNSGNVLLNGHPVDLKFATLTLGLMSRAGTEPNFNPSGIFQFDQGTVDATTIAMGVCSGNSPTSRANGILTVGAGGTLIAGNISLANISSGVAGQGATGTLNIFGGSATVAADILKTTSVGSTGAVSVADSGVLAVNGRIGSPANPIDNLNLTNGTLVVSPSSSGTNASVVNLATEGANTIEIGIMPSITAYPATFRLIKYQGAIAGAGFSFTLSGLPGAYTGSLVDNGAEGAVDLVITAGPVAQNIVWNGDLSDDWNILTTKNWRVGAVATNYFDGDFVTFNDTALGATTVDLTTDLLPGSVTVNNTTLSYSFVGSGKVGGLTGLTKQGTGTLVLNNTGVNDFAGSVAISGGTLQVGNGGTSGNLGPSTISMDAGLTINRSDDLTLANVVSGGAGGTLTKLNASVLTLSGGNTFTGAVVVAQGTLKAGNVSALGRTNGITTISPGATLDVNDLNLGLERIFVSGSGVGGQGAIVENTGGTAFNQANVAYVTLLGDTTFGGTGRWDLRSANTADPSQAALSTGGQPYKLTKVGTNGVYLPGVTVDPALGDVDILQGTLAVETATTGLGNPASNLVVHAGATLQFFNLTNLFDKVMTLNGTGTNNTVNNASGSATVIGPMNLVGDCLFNAGGTSLTLSNVLSGSGSLIKVGGTILTLAGGNDTYSGNTTLSNGTLLVNNIITGGGTLTSVAGTSLGGTGTNTGPVNVSGTLAPGTSAGTFGCGNLTLQTGATLAFELNSVTTIGGGVNDLINVTGDLIANGNSFTIALLGPTLHAGTYRLINYTGSLIGNLDTNISLGGASRYTFVLDTNTVGQVNLIVGGGPSSLVWESVGSTTWDVAVSSNWFNASIPGTDAFFQGDGVLFNDTPGLMTTIDIPAGVGVAPATATFDSTNNPYTINGPGRISGGASIVKKGDSILVLNTTNDFAGPVIVQQGTLQVGNNSALGNVTGGTVISNGATLDVGIVGALANTVNLGTEGVTVSGAGVFGQGAIINNTFTAQQNAVRVVNLIGDTTVGGNGRWDIRGAGAALSTGGNAYNLTKVGANQVTFVGVAVDPAFGNVDVQQGTFSIETTSTAGDPTKTFGIQAGAVLQFFNLSLPLDKRVGLTNATINNDSGVNNIMVGPVILDGSCTIDVDGGSTLTISNTVSGVATLTKVETGTLNLSSVTYVGDTTINAGTLGLLGTASLAGSPNITMNAGSLSVAGRVDGTLSLGSQTFAANGTVIGNLTAGAGSTVLPGGFAVGRLSVTGNASLSGTVSVEVDKFSFTNDVLSAASVVYGGTLQLTPLSLPFGAGDSLKLFDATSYSGNFSSISPATPGAGLVWYTGDLTNNGTLRVVSAAPMPQPYVSFTYSGFDVTLGGTNGPAYGPYRILATTNLALPVGSWSVLTTNYFDANGQINPPFSVPVDPNQPQRFYLLTLP